MNNSIPAEIAHIHLFETGTVYAVKVNIFSVLSGVVSNDMMELRSWVECVPADTPVIDPTTQVNELTGSVELLVESMNGFMLP